MINVKVARIPGTVVEVVLDDSATVSEALSAANLTLAEGESPKLNGQTTGLDASVSDGDRIVVAKGAKGNAAKKKKPVKKTVKVVPKPKGKKK
jgi:hypothetical protein